GLCAIDRSRRCILAATAAKLSRWRDWIMESSATGRGGATGHFSFLASRRPGLGRQNSGEMTGAGGTLGRRTNPDLWYPILLVVGGILFFSDPLLFSK